MAYPSLFGLSDILDNNQGYASGYVAGPQEYVSPQAAIPKWGQSRSGMYLDELSKARRGQASVQNPTRKPLASPMPRPGNLGLAIALSLIANSLQKGAGAAGLSGFMQGSQMRAQMQDQDNERAFQDQLAQAEQSRQMYDADAEVAKLKYQGAAADERDDKNFLQQLEYAKQNAENAGLVRNETGKREALKLMAGAKTALTMGEAIGMYEEYGGKLTPEEKSLKMRAAADLEKKNRDKNEKILTWGYDSQKFLTGATASERLQAADRIKSVLDAAVDDPDLRDRLLGTTGLPLDVLQSQYTSGMKRAGEMRVNEKYQIQRLSNLDTAEDLTKARIQSANLNNRLAAIALKYAPAKEVAELTKIQNQATAALKSGPLVDPGAKPMTTNEYVGSTRAYTIELENAKAALGSKKTLARIVNDKLNGTRPLGKDKDGNKESLDDLREMKFLLEGDGTPEAPGQIAAENSRIAAIKAKIGELNQLRQAASQPTQSAGVTPSGNRVISIKPIK